GNIADFWRRWHISLSNWFRDYVYIPLGGNQKGRARTLANLTITMLLSGLWHGAAWTFVIWGLFHGLLLLLDAQLGRALRARWEGALVTRFGAGCWCCLRVACCWSRVRAGGLEQFRVGVGSIAHDLGRVWAGGPGPSDEQLLFMAGVFGFVAISA